METWRKLLLLALAVGLAILTGLSWGSVGSAVCIYGLITMGAALLIKHFLINRDEDSFEAE